MYDLFLFNNATKKTYIYTGLEDTGEKLYYEFDNFDPGDIPYGEYSYALIYNELAGVEYTPRNALLETEVAWQGNVYRLRDLNPETGLLKYLNEDTEEPAYRDTDKEFYYRRK